MSRLEIILSSVLVLSTLFNIGILAYARSAMIRLLWVAEELDDLQTMINSFSNHVQTVYEMDTFYGDQTLQGLMDHARSFDEQLETFEYIYSLIETEESPLDDDTETAGQETQEEN